MKKGDFVIVRTESAGVFAGNLYQTLDRRIILKNARRIWYWAGAASLSELANSGTSQPNKCKFPEAVSEVIIFQCVEILKCSKTGEESIKAVKPWKA